MSILPPTSVLMKQGARRIQESAGERIWQELAALLSLPHSYSWADYMDRELDLWHYILPGRLRMEETRQNYYHVENVWRHSLRTMLCLESIIKEMPITLSNGQLQLEKLQAELAGRKSRLSVLKLSTLLHDVGKPDTASTNENGTISFHGHPEAGLPYAEILAKQLKMSWVEKQYLLDLVRFHMKPLHLYTSRDKSDLAVYRLYRDLQPNPFDVLILSLADLTATYTAGERLSESSAYTSFCLKLIEEYSSRQNFYNPPSFLKGDDLLALGVPKGPIIGEYLKKLNEAQITGEVQDTHSAKKWISNKLTKRCLSPKR
nr:HD domain-containing protein [Desulforamulus aquiferis]